jgi:hypothetical protein
MTTIKKASQAGARRVASTLDTVASLVQFHGASLGIPQKVAMDFAYRCDLLSDSLGRRLTAGYFNPAEIGTEKPGPMEYDTNNPFMAGEFTLEKYRALSEKQMAGELAANAAKGVADPKLASVIKKAAYDAALTALLVAKKANETKADDEETEEEETEESEEDEGEKEEKTAALAQAYNRLRREAAKKGEVPAAFKAQWDKGDAKKDEPKDEPKKDEKKSSKKADEEPKKSEEPKADEKSEEPKADEAKKTAKLFGLFS